MSDGAGELHRCLRVGVAWAAGRLGSGRRMEVRRRLLDEARPTADRAERVDDAVVLGEVAGVPRSTVMPQTGSSRTMSSTTGLESAATGSPARRAGERRRPGRRHEVRPAAADLDELGEDREGDLLGRLGAEVDARPAPAARRAAPRRRPSRRAATARTTSARVGEATRPDVATRRGASAAASASSSQMPWVATTTYGLALGVDAARGRSPA